MLGGAVSFRAMVGNPGSGFSEASDVHTIGEYGDVRHFKWKDTS